MAQFDETLRALKEQKDQELIQYKRDLDAKLERVKGHLNEQARKINLELFEKLKKQVEESNTEAYQMYERKMGRVAGAPESMKKALKDSATNQLESSLNFNKRILDNFLQSITK